MHSSKGLDFPVVLLCLPYLGWRKAYDEEQTERLLRNVIYVGITRAMDNVNVFTLEGEDPILRDLQACFGDRPQEIPREQRGKPGGCSRGGAAGT